MKNPGGGSRGFLITLLAAFFSARLFTGWAAEANIEIQAGQMDGLDFRADSNVLGRSKNRIASPKIAPVAGEAAEG